MRKSAWASLLVVALLLTACGTAMQPSAPAKTESGEAFLLALPRLVVDFDASGTPSAFGLKLDEVGRLLGQDLSSVRLNRFYTDWMTAANIQHIEMRQTGDGLALLVNGVPLPHIAWTDQSLQRAADVAAALNLQGMDVVRELLPMVRRLGLDVVLRFPLQPGARAIPLAEPSLAVAPAKPEQTAPTAVIRFEVKYDGRGVPAILGLSAQDLRALGLDLPLALAPDAIRTLQGSNIQYVQIRTKPDGMYVYVNGEPLPNLVWDNTLLVNAANLYAQMNPGSPFVELARQVVPSLDNLDMDILLHFPRAPDVAPIPIKRQ